MIRFHSVALVCANVFVKWPIFKNWGKSYITCKILKLVRILKLPLKNSNSCISLRIHKKFYELTKNKSDEKRLKFFSLKCICLETSLFLIEKSTLVLIQKLMGISFSVDETFFICKIFLSIDKHLHLFSHPTVFKPSKLQNDVFCYCIFGHLIKLMVMQKKNLKKKIKNEKKLSYKIR